MARIRTIKPDFWKSEAIAVHSFRTRLTFIGLWTYVDDNGVGLDNPKLVAAELFALEDDPRETLANVREDLASLAVAGRITRYEVAGKRYLAIVNWDEHQKIDRPGRARYPQPDAPDAVILSSENTELDGLFATPSREIRVDVEHRSRLEQGTGNREQGTDTSSPPPAATAPVPGSDADPDWCKFWAVYPKRVAKQDARKRWASAIKKGADAAAIIAAAERYAMRVRAERTDPSKVKNPDGWLNGERWHDALPLSVVRNQPAHIYRNPDSPDAYAGYEMKGGPDAA